ncbi:MAG: antibiotic biosynthesis regulator FhaA [Mycobacteriales bacterium]
MGVLQKFERRLEGLVEGAFARVFKGVVEPVEVAGALQREAEARKTIVGVNRILVPNDYTVELGAADHERLAPWEQALGAELGAMLEEHAQEQGWSFIGPVRVRLERNDDLDTGVFRVRSGVAAAGEPLVAAAAHAESKRPTVVPTEAGVPEPVAAAPAGDPAATQAVVMGPPGRPRLVVPTKGGGPAEELLELTKPVTTIGRGTGADLRLPDTGVSRNHAELHINGNDVVLVDLGSTNGSSVNGATASRVVLRDGDRIEIGRTTLVFHRDGA